MKQILFIILVGTIFWSCSQNRKFEKKGWIYKDDMEYPYRDAMVNDLTQNYHLAGLKLKELFELVGEPEWNRIGEINTIYYEIKTKYHVIDPVSGKDLIIKFDKDSIVTSFEVNQWKH